MLLGNSRPANPILDDAFKDDVIYRRSKAAASAPVQNGEVKETKVNVTSELISEWLPAVLKRFGCCTCDRCSAQAAVEAFDSIRPIVVRVKSEKDLERVRKVKDSNRQSVLMALVRIAGQRRKLPKHD